MNHETQPAGAPAPPLAVTVDPEPPRAVLTRDRDVPAGEPLPARLGRYHVLERLGAGGMGVVYAAYDPELDRKVAIKLLHFDRGRDSQVRLLREAQALARLSHPNVVQIHDAGAFGQRVFLAMEFVRGVDLRAWLTAASRSEADIVRVFVAAGRGLAAAHAQGLVHRDFKPENVLVGEDGRVCVADFGLARAGPEAPATGTVGTALELSLTATGAVLGTPAYMSPEQHRGQPADARSDQFSFCVAVWEALCGERPFAGDSLAATAAAVLAGRVRPPPASRRVSRRLLDVLDRGLQTDPARRFADMSALLHELSRDPVRARRRAFVTLALLFMSFCAAYFIADRRAREAEACSGGASELAGVWDGERRAAVDAALRRDTDRGLGPRVLAGLDARAAAWIAGKRDACLDHRRGEQSSALFDARVRCLERRRQALGRAVDLLLAPDPAPDPAQLVARLPAIADCDDPATDPGVSGFDDPVRASLAAEVEAKLIAARALHHAADHRAARDAIEAVVTAARRHDLRALLAEARLLEGHILMELGDLVHAREAVGEAVLHNLATQRDALAAEALAVQIFLDGRLGDRTRAEILAPLARALAERLPAPAALLARLENNLGTLAHDAGDHATAEAHFERATRGLLATADPDPLELANYFVNLGVAAAEPRAGEAAFARAAELFARSLGEGHTRFLTLELIRALVDPDLAAGAARLDLTCARFADLHPDLTSDCATCFQYLGLTRAELGDIDAALAAFARVPVCLRESATDPTTADFFAIVRGRAAAAIAMLEDRPREALAHADAALRVAEPDQSMWWIAAQIAELQLVRGRALLALGRRDDAVPALERAIALLTGLRREHTDALFPRWLDVATALLAKVSAP